MTAYLLSRRVFSNDKVILILFAVYGLAAGSVAYVWKLSSAESFSPLYFYMNLPVMLILAFIEVSFGDPLGFLASFPVALMPLYAILWLLIGFAAYGIVRMLRDRVS